MKLSFVPLLLGGKLLSPEARAALNENRRADAATLLMQQYDLDCREAGELVDVSICDDEKSDQNPCRSGNGGAKVRLRSV